MAVIGALGIAYAVFKSATVTKTIDLLETENKALGQSVNRQSGDITVLQGRVTTLEDENKLLRGMVTGKTAIDDLAEQVNREERNRREEHAQMAASNTQMMTLLNSIMTILKDILAALRGRRPEAGTGEIGR